MTKRVWKKMGGGRFYLEGDADASEFAEVTHTFTGLDNDEVYNGSLMQVVDETEKSLTIFKFKGSNSHWVPVAKVAMPASS